jgi:pimeloyl-ACP methyl ester carboxylesterase
MSGKPCRRAEEYSVIEFEAEVPSSESITMQRREFIGGLGMTAVGAICRSSLGYAQDAGSLAHRTIGANGIHLHFVEQGEGPLVVLCHGFPELWYSWRHQLSALSTAGFRAVAVDMRGYGQSDRPEAIDQYTLLNLVGDMVGLLDKLGVQRAVIAGHDWGAVVAWHAALLRPDRFRAVIALSLPYLQRSPVAPTLVMPRRKDGVFYLLYFQEPGVAEAELEHDVRQTFLKVLGGASVAGAPRERSSGPFGMVPRDGVLSGRPTPTILPDWLTEADIDFYVDEFERTGFRGGLNWYRNIDRNWELLAPFEGAKISDPALYMAGDRDLALAFQGVDRVVANLADNVPQLRGKVILPGCGHFTQQERASEVNAAMIDFLRQL